MKEINESEWFKSSYSAANGNCCEAARLPDGGMAIRDSKDPAAPALYFNAAETKAFLDGVKDGEFDQPQGGGRSSGLRPRVRPRDLPALIKAERTRRGLSLREAAAESGISFTTLARFEQGRLPYLDCFFATAAWLNVSPDWLADAPVEGDGS